jgi:hypothetical protein
MSESKPITEFILQPQKETEIELQLGDVITITNPKNEKLNNQTFIIDYIDKAKMYLINTDTLDKIKLKISEDGIIGDGTITQINLLSRSDSPSYARQNDLLPSKWLNIYFSGEYPIIITGQITNLEGDMIEIKTVDEDIIYINFEYKGIPEDLPIENIEIREKPEEPKKERELPELEREQVFVEKVDYQIPIQNVKNQLREFIIRADQISFGNEELGPIVQYVDVSSESQRYSIEVQVSDLLDELLSTIPNSQRTRSVLNNIHIMIERFKQLREKYSLFDKYGVVESALVNESTYKPLTQYFKKFKHNLLWILPVVENVKKIYAITEIEMGLGGDMEKTSGDVKSTYFKDEIFYTEELINNYKGNNLPDEQNKYSLLYKELNPYFTPFNLINEESSNDILIEKHVDADLNVIINNLENMYSSIFTKNNIRSRRFIIQKYNLGLTKLDTIDTTSSRIVTTRVKMTDPDIMSIKSFVTLPEVAIRFSKINLPGTTILERANLNQVFLNYWEFLNKNTLVSDVFIEQLGSEIEFNENNFVNNVKNYILNLSAEDKKGLTKEDIYAQFVNTIIPKTKIIFDLMKKYIIGKLSIVDVVSYLEPFLVYTEDLTYMQFREIVKFIDEKISDFNKIYIDRSRLFQTITRINKSQLILNNAYSIISIIDTKNNLRDQIFDSYDILVGGNNLRYKYSNFTNSEILRKIMLKDCGKLYTCAISLESAPLMIPSQYTSLFESEKEKMNSKFKMAEESEECAPIIVAKYYDSIEELTGENGKNIYFDKKYDKTNYNLLNNYEKEIVSLTPENLKQHITIDLKKKLKLNDHDSDYLANTLLDGHKLVIDGQYAILYKKDIVPDYYIRKQNKWVLDKEVANKLNANTADNSILCDLQKKCINVSNNESSEPYVIGRYVTAENVKNDSLKWEQREDKCMTLEADELSIQNKLLKNILSEFDEKYKITKEEFEKEIKSNFDYYASIIDVLSNIEYNNMLKYNNQKYRLAENIDETKSMKPISPYTSLLNLILSQSDFVKKQNDIIRFVNTYTRPPIADAFGPLNEIENIHWLYCIKTNIPILPIFKYNLASVFITNNSEYRAYLDQTISKIGKLSDDGDSWIDENSGWCIVKVDFDIEEGYEEGFKVSSRGLLEEDAGNKILSSSTTNIKYDTFETKTISNIVNTLSVAMGINIEIQKEFIINNVLVSIRDTIEPEEEYRMKIKEMAEKGKKIMSYEDFYNSAILYYTFGMFLIAIQTVIPSIKTRKTHPGCVRSFTGYPFDGSGDLSSLNYVSCVAYDIRESGKPWNVLKGKKTDFIANKIKASIDTVLINIPQVIQKFDEKTDYLLTNQSNELAEEHDITNWKHFLPPLVPIKLKHLVNISDEFKKSLLSDLKSGSGNQREKLLVIDSKIIQFSFAIQHKIQELVKKKHLLLTNSNNEPYLENSCCESKEDNSTIDYFTQQSPEIIEYNTIVQKLSNIIEDVTSYSKSGLFLSLINTKNKYPSISQSFDEKIIYLAFIHFCKFKTLLPIPEDLLPLCTDKPDLSVIQGTLGVEQIIQKLKDAGRSFQADSFLRLLQLVGRKNIIYTDFDKPHVSSISKLLATIESIDEEKDEVVEGALIKLITSALDTFEIASNETTKEIKNLNDYLIRNNEGMIEDIKDFINRYKGPDITRSAINKFNKSISNMSNWTCEKNQTITISDDCLYNTIQFYKSFITNFVNLFPNIILNKVDYENILIPKYLGLTTSHSNKLQTNIEKYYTKLRVLYGKPEIYNILKTIQKTSKNLVKLSQETPCFTSIKTSEYTLKPVLDERTSRFLFQYYLLRIIINYIDLADDNDMLITEVTKPAQEEDLFTVQYLEEKDNREDVQITQTDRTILSGNKKGLKQSVAQLLMIFFEILDDQKDIIDISYDDILDRVFKLKEKEKDMITDRLKSMTDEVRDADTILKINKLGVWSKGLQKGLTTYVKQTYDDERDFREEMDQIEKTLRNKNKNKNMNNENLDIEDYLEQNDIENEIENEVYNMSNINEDYWDGNEDEMEDNEDYY